ncbi:ecdysteroid 22-kinase family protein, partial [Shewanella sp. C31]|nr:ecdysteroid 22-kinase family protein [Shewanella electrica]
NLIVKKGEGSGKLATMMKGCFKNETRMYLNVFKEMEYLMEEVGDTEEPLWCKCIHYEPKSASLILEDLKASGFRLTQRQ